MFLRPHSRVTASGVRWGQHVQAGITFSWAPLLSVQGSWWPAGDLQPLGPRSPPDVLSSPTWQDGSSSLSLVSRGAAYERKSVSMAQSSLSCGHVCRSLVGRTGNAAKPAISMRRSDQGHGSQPGICKPSVLLLCSPTSCLWKKKYLQTFSNKQAHLPSRPERSLTQPNPFISLPLFATDLSLSLLMFSHRSSTLTSLSLS